MSVLPDRFLNKKHPHSTANATSYVSRQVPLNVQARRRAPGSGPGDGSPNELDDAGPKGAELPRPGTRRRPVPADVLRGAAPRRDASASPAAAEFHRALLRAGAADGSRVIELGVYLQGRYTDRDGGRI